MSWSPSHSRERCEVRAQLRGDHMLGTAFPAARLLLVEEPFPWGPEGLRTSRFDPATALALEARGRTEGVRVQAIRRPGRASRRARRRWAIIDTRGETPTLSWGEFTHPAELLELPLDGSLGQPDPSPLYLVCTHGKHDPCCALRGRPVAAALEAVRPRRVWQASHLGGCRFAPTVLVLPLGLMYGRVPPTDAREFVAAAEAGEVVGALLRGRVGVPPAAQAAIGFAHGHLELPRCRDISLVSTTPIDGGTVLVRVGSPHGLFDVTVKRERVDATGLTCAKPGPSWFVAHHPVAIEPVDDVAAGGSARGSAR
jgi:(2Fe-2S) ferredoxin